MKKQNIEVEGGELLIQSKEGHYAIIPAKHRLEIIDMVKDGCDDCINNYIQALPKDSDYAEDGSLYPEEPSINPNNPIKLPEVTITAEAPTYIKYRRAWAKENPFDIDKYVEDRFNNPVGREAIKRINEKAWKEHLRQEGLKKRQAELNEATKMGLLYQRFNPQGKDDMPIADEQFQKRYGTSPHRYRYDNDSEYRKYYEQQARNATSTIDYPSTDLRRKDVVAPNNMWMYPNLTGENKKAMTDFSNEVIGTALPIPGLEAMGKIPSVFKAGKNLVKNADKVIDATKTGSKVLNKTDDVVKNLNTTKKFKSEIDWAKWNPNTPNHKVLMDEYNAIEESTKRAGTWMKNPDGSVFQGTPEQFVQQQSSWFKKAFGDSKVKGEIVYHGTHPLNKFEEFDCLKISSNSNDQAFYFAQDKNYAKNRGGRVIDAYLDIQNPTYGGYLEDGSDGFVGGFMGVRNPTQIKSAKGNVGFFDMTNPNIYKGIIPPAVLFYLQSQQNNKKEE